MEWIDIIRNLGLPTAVSLALGMGVWRVCAWSGPRLETWIGRIVASHEALTQSCISVGQSNADTLSKLQVVSAAQTSALYRIETFLAKITGAQDPHHPTP